MVHPPCKSGLAVDPAGDRALSCFDWVGLLDIGKSFPARRTILPLDAWLPFLGALLHVLAAIDDCVAIGALRGMFVRLVVHCGLQQLTLVSINVALGPHVLRDHIGRAIQTDICNNSVC
jgi:hypothetical protein